MVHCFLIILLIENLIMAYMFYRKMYTYREALQMLIDKVSELHARQLILESRMGYEVTSFEISKQSKH